MAHVTIYAKEPCDEVFYRDAPAPWSQKRQLLECTCGWQGYVPNVDAAIPEAQRHLRERPGSDTIVVGWSLPTVQRVGRQPW